MKKICEKRGVALITVIIVVVVLSVLGLALMNVSSSENRFTDEQEVIQQAHYVSLSAARAFANYISNWPVPTEANQKDARSHLIEDILANGNSIATDIDEMDPTVVGDTLEYQLVLNKVSATQSDVVVTSIGTYRNISRSVLFRLSEMRYFDAAIFSFTDINMNNSSVAYGNGAPFVAGGTAYAHNDAYTQKYLGGGEIYDSSVSTGDPTPYIEAYTSIFKPASDSTYFSYPSGLEHNENDANIEFVNGLIIRHSDLSTNYEFNRTVGNNTTTAKGIYFGSVSFGTHVHVTVNNDSSDDLFLEFDTLYIPNHSSLTINAPQGRVFLLISDSTIPDYTPQNINDGELVVNGEIQASSTTQVGNFIIYASDTVQRLIIRTSSNPDQNALIIAPYSEVIIRNSNNYTGSIIANKVVMENLSSLTYPSFDGLFGTELGLPSLGYRVSDWRRP